MNPTFLIGGDMAVHRMGYGAMRVTGPGIWGPPADKDAAIALLRRVVELGVDFIDTADAYGPNVSEELLAEALHPYPDGLVIATKGGLVRGGPNDWRSNGTPEHLKKACEGSLRRLRTDCIDLYQLHVVADAVPIEDSLGALAELQQAGKVRHIGVSNVSVQELQRARKVVEVTAVQNRYNLGNRKYEAVLQACEEAGIGFIPWYPLAAGEITGRQQFQQVAGRHGATPGQLSLAWLLHRSEVMLPIPGTSSIAHLEENTAARQIALSAEEMAGLEAMARA